MYLFGYNHLFYCIHLWLQSRVLKNDFARYNDDLDIDEQDGEDNGWKIIHTDVFRFPKQKSLFCAVLGMYDVVFEMID